MSAEIPPPDGLRGIVERKAGRKLRGQARGDRSLWSGLGTLGVVGWSIALPTLLGALAGLWLDHHYPGPRSWTLALLVAGLVLGCAQAWRWVARQERKIRKEETDNDK